MDSLAVNKIAVVRRNGLGDLLCATPLMLYLKKLYPEAELTLFADHRNAGLLPFLTCYDRSVIFPSNNKYLSVLSTAIRYRRDKFDIAISAKPTEMKLLNLFLAGLGAKMRIAVGTNKWHSKFLNAPRAPYTTKRHQALKCLQLIAPEMIAVPTELYPKIRLPKECQPNLPYWEHPFVLMTSVTNNRYQSTLNPEKHAQIINAFSEAHPCHVALSCMPHDSEKAHALAKLLRTPCSVVPTQNLADLLYLIDRSNLVFVGDGGIMHFAAALEKPQVTLFGVTLVEEWKPLSDKAICLFHPIDVKQIDSSLIIEALILKSS